MNTPENPSGNPFKDRFENWEGPVRPDFWNDLEKNLDTPPRRRGLWWWLAGLSLVGGMALGGWLYQNPSNRNPGPIDTESATAAEKHEKILRTSPEVIEPGQGASEKVRPEKSLSSTGTGEGLSNEKPGIEEALEGEKNRPSLPSPKTAIRHEPRQTTGLNPSPRRPQPRLAIEMPVQTHSGVRAGTHSRAYIREKKRSPRQERAGFPTLSSEAVRQVRQRQPTSRASTSVSHESEPANPGLSATPNPKASEETLSAHEITDRSSARKADPSAAPLLSSAPESPGEKPDAASARESEKNNPSTAEKEDKPVVSTASDSSVRQAPPADSPASKPKTPKPDSSRAQNPIRYWAGLSVQGFRQEVRWSRRPEDFAGANSRSVNRIRLSPALGLHLSGEKRLLSRLSIRAELVAMGWIETVDYRIDPGQAAERLYTSNPADPNQMQVSPKNPVGAERVSTPNGLAGLLTELDLHSLSGKQGLRLGNQVQYRFPNPLSQPFQFWSPGLGLYRRNRKWEGELRVRLQPAFDRNLGGWSETAVETRQILWGWVIRRWI